jgi:hypothetical protein
VKVFSSPYKKAEILLFFPLFFLQKQAVNRLFYKKAFHRVAYLSGRSCTGFSGYEKD